MCLWITQRQLCTTKSPVFKCKQNSGRQKQVHLHSQKDTKPQLKISSLAILVNGICKKEEKSLVSLWTYQYWQHLPHPISCTWSITSAAFTTSLEHQNSLVGQRSKTVWLFYLILQRDTCWQLLFQDHKTVISDAMSE